MSASKLLVSVATAALVATSGAACAQESTVTLKFAHWVPPAHPIHQRSVGGWTKAVEESSGGTIKWMIFPAGQLGKAEDHYDIAKDGIADAAWINPGFSAGRFPVIGAAQMPQLIADGRTGSAALDDWYKQYAPREMPDVKICLVHTMYPLTFHAKKPIKRPEDLKGLKIRPSSAIEAAYLRSIGASPVPGTFPETRDMLDRGVIDGTTGVWASMIAFGIHKSVLQHIDLPFTVVPYVLAINKSKYDKLSARQKQAIDANCNAESAATFGGHLYDFELDGLKRLLAMGDKGRVVYKPTPDDVEAWRATIPAVKAAWSKEVSAKGYDAEAIFNSLVTKVKERNAQPK